MPKPPRLPKGPPPEADPDMMAAWATIDQQREALGIPIARLCTACAIASHNTYRSWIRGEKIPNVATMWRVCKLLRLQIAVTHAESDHA